MAPAVQDDLKLTEKQKSQLTKFFSDMDQKRRDLFPTRNRNQNQDQNPNSDPNLNPDPNRNPQGRGRGRGGFGGANFEAMRANFEKLQQETDDAIAKVLNPRQLERLKQIELRRDGPAAFAKQEIAEKLNLSPDQVESVQMVLNQMRQTQRERFQELRRNDAGNGNGGFDREAMKQRRDSPESKAQMAKLQQDSEKLRSQALQEMTQILRRKQRETYNRMLGKAFDLSKLREGASAAGVASSRDPEAANASAKTRPSQAPSAKSRRRRPAPQPDEVQ
jgi:hypothetical protein